MDIQDAGIADIDGLFGDLEDDDYLARRAAVKSRRAETRAIRTALRHQRRAAAEAELAQLLPARIAPGDCWHVISQGDVDALSYLSHVLQHTRPEYVLLSTWCMAQADVDAVGAWIESGVIGRIDAYVGEIFPSQYAAAHDALCRIVRPTGGRVAVFRNHSKVMLLGAPVTDDWLVIESSANVNTNPRAEQTAIFNDRGTYEFFKRFYDGVRSYNRNFDDWTPHGWQTEETDRPQGGDR